MTLEQAKRLHNAGSGMFDWSNYCDFEQEEIRKEMEAVVSAKSDRSAAKVIAWWDCWNRSDTPTAWVRRARAEWAKIQEEEACDIIP